MINDDKEIFKFPVLLCGFAYDSKAWVMERDDGSRYLKMTNNGCEYEAKIEELNERISSYEAVIEQTREAIEILK